MPTAPEHEALRQVQELEDLLHRSGFVRCDLAACNCGSWHHRYGLPQRMDEIKQALSDAGHPLSNSNGNLVLNALKELIAERDALTQTGGWQPIETAPKDGRSVLLLGRNARHADGFWEKKAYAGNWVWPYVKAEPIAWQPLPPSPAAERAQERGR